MIYIFHGPIRSGKTTFLMEWTKKRTDVGGILTPDPGDIRRLYDIRHQSFHPLQFQGELGKREPVTVIGRFVFYNSALSNARRILRESLVERCNWLIIDEIGRLELRGEGLEPTVSEIIAFYQRSEQAAKLLLVVRDELKDAVVAHYQIQQPQFIDMKKWDGISSLPFP
ncbi:MAG: hypothetical protein HC880_10080 [Bacteroidia bacterium]|nr:hypothetical protein [Bacteroidia bacterium]